MGKPNGKNRHNIPVAVVCDEDGIRDATSGDPVDPDVLDAIGDEEEGGQHDDRPRFRGTIEITTFGDNYGFGKVESVHREDAKKEGAPKKGEGVWMLKRACEKVRELGIGWGSVVGTVFGPNDTDDPEKLKQTPWVCWGLSTNEGIPGLKIVSPPAPEVRAANYVAKGRALIEERVDSVFRSANEAQIAENDLWNDEFQKAFDDLGNILNGEYNDLAKQHNDASSCIGRMEAVVGRLVTPALVVQERKGLASDLRAKYGRKPVTTTAPAPVPASAPEPEPAPAPAPPTPPADVLPPPEETVEIEAEVEEVTASSLDEDAILVEWAKVEAAAKVAGLDDAVAAMDEAADDEDITVLANAVATVSAELAEVAMSPVERRRAKLAAIAA